MPRELNIEALERFFRTTSVPMTLAAATEPDSPLLLANDAFLELTGYTRDDVIGRNCRFLQGPKTDQRARAKLRVAVETGIETLVPITNYRKDGLEFENYVFLLPIYGPDGSLRYFMGSQYDITAPFRSVSLQEQVRLVDEGLISASGRPAATTLLGTLARFRGEGRGG